MSIKVNRPATAKENFLASARLAVIVSRLSSKGLRSLAEETDRLAGLEIAEDRDALALSDLSNYLRNEASILDAQQTAI